MGKWLLMLYIHLELRNMDFIARNAETVKCAVGIRKPRRREMSEQALDAHLEQWEQRPEEMIEVERGYLEWLEGRVEQLGAKVAAIECAECEKSMLHCTCDDGQLAIEFDRIEARLAAEESE